MEERTQSTDSLEFELDLSNAHLHDLSQIQIPETLTDLDLTCNRLSKIDPRILSLTGLKQLCFRQNLLSDLNEIAMLKSKSLLEMLDLRDNQFVEIPLLLEFSSLKFLEVSYNKVRSMQPLTSLSAIDLESLYLASNKLTAIESLNSCSKLKVLELGFNRIKRIENIDHLNRLEELWLGRNRITQIENMEPLSSLKRLSLQSNRLTSMQGLENCLSLEELYLSHNGITQIQGLKKLTGLKVLDVSNNQISKLEGLETLSQLEDLWLNDNQLSTWDDLDAALEGPRQSITTIYFENNPIATHLHYKTRVRAMFPNLTQLDADILASS